MSDFQVQSDWWLASDGRWYPPSAQPGYSYPPPVQDAVPPSPGYGAMPQWPSGPYGTAPQWPSGPYGPPPSYPTVVMQVRPTVSPVLSAWLQGLFWATGLLAVLTAMLGFAALPKFDEFWDAPAGTVAEQRAYDEWIDADDAFSGASAVGTFVWIAGFVVLLVWMHKAHRATQTLGPGPRNWNQGWTIGGWFIPLANFVLPKLVLNEIERISTAPRAGGMVSPDWRRGSTSAIGWLWWIALSTGILLVAAGSSVMPTEDDVLFSADDVRNGYTVHSLGLLAMAAGCCFGALFVRRLSRRLSPTGIL